TFFLFGVAVVMFAGSGSTFEQMFGISPMVGSIIMFVLTILTLLLDTNKIISIIAAVTPYLIAVILITVAYFILTMDISLTAAVAIAKEQTSALTDELLSALLYVSYNISAAAALLINMAGQAKDNKVAAIGGIIGGSILGLLI